MKKWCITAVLCLSFVAARDVSAQVNTASLAGLVKDPSGAVIPNAKITARNPSVGIQRTSQSNGDGYYFLPDLPVGRYEISVEKTRLSDRCQHR